MTLILSISSTACSAPRLSGRAESEHLEQSPCEQAYELATLNKTRTDAGQPVVTRYIAAAEAQRQWLLVAANCPQRFAQGSLYSAQSAMIHADLARKLGQADPRDDPDSSPLEEGTITGVNSSVLTSMALAEDRAGFAIEVMAARNIPGASIATSDAYKVSATKLISAAVSKDAKITDPRQKIYDVDTILTHPRTMSDPVTGITTPTLAIIEADCAREQIAAFTKGAATDATYHSAQSASQNANGRNREQSLLTLAVLVSDHAKAAFTEGYPAFDHALFA